eukprot:2102349-Amphidinium_carterae.1
MATHRSRQQGKRYFTDLQATASKTYVEHIRTPQWYFAPIPMQSAEDICCVSCTTSSCDERISPSRSSRRKPEVEARHNLAWVHTSQHGYKARAEARQEDVLRHADPGKRNIDACCTDMVKLHACPRNLTVCTRASSIIIAPFEAHLQGALCSNAGSSILASQLIRPRLPLTSNASNLQSCSACVVYNNHAFPL